MRGSLQFCAAGVSDARLFKRLFRFDFPWGYSFSWTAGFTVFLLLVGRLGTIPLAATNTFNINTRVHADDRRRCRDFTLVDSISAEMTRFCPAQRRVFTLRFIWAPWRFFVAVPECSLVPFLCNPFRRSSPAYPIAVNLSGSWRFTGL